MMTINDKKAKEMNEASASVCLLLAPLTLKLIFDFTKLIT